VDSKRSAGTVNNIFSQWLGKPKWGLIGRSRRKSIYQRLRANGFWMGKMGLIVEAGENSGISFLLPTFELGSDLDDQNRLDSRKPMKVGEILINFYEFF